MSREEIVQKQLSSGLAQSQLKFSLVAQSPNIQA